MAEDRLTVEWFGGPEDGARFHVPVGTRSLRIALPPKPPSFTPEDADPQAISIDVAAVPIVIRNGRLYVQYPRMNGG
jgi:hypothetical protein